MSSRAHAKLADIACFRNDIVTVGRAPASACSSPSRTMRPSKTTWSQIFSSERICVKTQPWYGVESVAVQRDPSRPGGPVRTWVRRTKGVSFKECPRDAKTLLHPAKAPIFLSTSSSPTSFQPPHCLSSDALCPQFGCKSHILQVAYSRKFARPATVDPVLYHGRTESNRTAVHRTSPASRLNPL